MSDHQCPFLQICFFSQNNICHLYKCFFHTDRLSPLHDITIIRRAHDRLYRKRRCHKSLYPGKSAVFSECIQIIQYKIRSQIISELLCQRNDLFKGFSLFCKAADIKCNLCLTTGCGTGIKYMDFLVRIFFQIHTSCQISTVITATQISGQRYNVDIFCRTVKCLHIALRRRTGRLRTCRARCYLLQKVLLIKGFIIPYSFFSHL